MKGFVVTSEDGVAIYTPLHKQLDALKEVRTIMLNEPEAKAIRDILRRFKHDLNGFERDLLKQILRRYAPERI